MPEIELQQIEKWAAEVPQHGSIVEVGAMKGRSTYAWAMSCDPTVTVYAIDHFRALTKTSALDIYDEFLENTKDCTNVIPIKAWCPYVMWFPEVNIDVMFLDAAHMNPFDIDTIKYFLPKIKPGGRICGHDYSDAWPQVLENVAWLEGELNQKPELSGNCLWSFRV